MCARLSLIDRVGKRGLLFVAISLLCFLAVPIEVEGTDLAVLLKGGMLWPSYHGADYDAWRSTEGYDEAPAVPGFVVGAGIVYGINRFLAAQAEVLYANNMVTRGHGPFGQEFYDYIRVLELPVSAVLRLQVRALELYALAGPSLSLRVVPVEYEISGSSATWPEGQFSRFGVALVGGGGLNLHFRGGFFLNLDGRYQYGLTSVMNVAETGLEDWRLSGLRVTAGLGTFLTGEEASYGGRSRER